MGRQTNMDIIPWQEVSAEKGGVHQAEWDKVSLAWGLVGGGLIYHLETWLGVSSGSDGILGKAKWTKQSWGGALECGTSQKLQVLPKKTACVGSIGLVLDLEGFGDLAEDLGHFLKWVEGCQRITFALKKEHWHWCEGWIRGIKIKKLLQQSKLEISGICQDRKDRDMESIK